MPGTRRVPGTVALQNRVTPQSELVADPARGLVYGNRGCLHDADGRIRRRYNGKRWIACRLEFKGWHRAPLLQPAASPSSSSSTRRRRSPPATARARSAAARTTTGSSSSRGHPAGRCDRRAAARRAASTRARGRSVTTTRAFDELPDGTFVLDGGEPWLVLGDELLRWTPGRLQRPTGAAARASDPAHARRRSSRSCAPAGSRSSRSSTRHVCIFRKS